MLCLTLCCENLLDCSSPPKANAECMIVPIIHYVLSCFPNIPSTSAFVSVFRAVMPCDYYYKVKVSSDVSDY